MIEKELTIDGSVIVVRCYENAKGRMVIDSIPIVTDALDFCGFCNENDDWYKQIENLLQ